MSVYADFLPAGEFDDAAEWFKGEGGKVEGEAMPQHKHWCDGCGAFWYHEEPCEYGGADGFGTGDVDWPCPMCLEKGAPE